MLSRNFFRYGQISERAKGSVSFWESYQAVVELVVVRVRVRVASQLSNFLFHLLLHHPRYRAFRLRAIVSSLRENLMNVRLTPVGSLRERGRDKRAKLLHYTSIYCVQRYTDDKLRNGKMSHGLINVLLHNSRGYL